MKLKLNSNNTIATIVDKVETAIAECCNKDQQHIAVDFAQKDADTTVIAEVKTDTDGNKKTTIVHSFKSNQYDDRLPTVSQCQIPSWAMHIECPHCHAILNDWYINPEHSIQTCKSCGEKFNVARDIAMEIT